MRLAPSAPGPNARVARILLLVVTIWPGVAFAQQPEPLDPLTQEESREAERLARADQRVRDLLGPGGRLNYLEFLALKSTTESDQPRRHAEVMLLRDDSRYGVRAIVQLGTGAAVVSVQRVEESNVPMTDIELQSASRLANENAQVRSVLGAQLAQLQVEGLRVFTNDKRDPCFAQRCVRLLYRQGSDYLSDPVVIVNLSKPTVLVERRKR
jgi:Cu2+-containing amine oxidase